MTPGSDLPPDPFAGEFWDDVAFIIRQGEKRRAPEFAGPNGRAYRMIALNVNGGKAAFELIRMDVHREATNIDVATSLADLIMSGLDALSDYVPDVREFLEIQIKDYRVNLEHHGSPWT